MNEIKTLMIGLVAAAAFAAVGGEKKIFVGADANGTYLPGGSTPADVVWQAFQEFERARAADPSGTIELIASEPNGRGAPVCRAVAKFSRLKRVRWNGPEAMTNLHEQSTTVGDPRSETFYSKNLGANWWLTRLHERREQIALSGGRFDLVFLGDSITHFWERKYTNAWLKVTAGRKVLNCGYAGDKVNNLIWRAENGELDGYEAKAVVVLIGTNDNTSPQGDPADVAIGIRKVLDVVRAKQPKSKVVLCAIPPRGRGEKDEKHHQARVRNEKTNELIRRFADGQTVVWLDFGPALIDPQTGWVSKDLMPDRIHPSERGYAVWQAELEKVLGPANRVSLRRPATLFFAGDSTLDDHGRDPACLYASWGTALEKFMVDGCRVDNRAKSGASTKSFIADGHWAKLIASVQPGDWVAIQFGHNDQKRSTAHYLQTRWCDPKGAFRDNVRGWVAEIRAKGAMPILLSPIVRATFGEDGKTLVDRGYACGGVCLRSYRDAMAELAAELACDFVDMNGLTYDEIERLGATEAHKCFHVSTGIRKGKDGEPSKDTTHPIRAGAEDFARLFLEDVTARQLPIAALFRPTERVNDAPFAMPAIIRPSFADRNFPITDFGAKPGGTVCTESIAAAMEACERAGGGCVVVPKGIWLTGAVHFRNNCNLRLEKDAMLEFTDNPADYPEVHTTWEGVECYNHSPLLFAYGVTNVAITGSGTIAPRMGVWRTWFERTPQHMKATETLYYWCSTNAPVESRRLLALDRAHMRPQLIQFNRCGNVLLEDFKIRESPFWMIHLYHSENCVVRNLDTFAHGHNNDGIDVDMTKNVLVEKCHFDQGDDGVCLKAGRNADAWRLNRCTENVVVRDCDMVESHSLLGLGSELSGGIRNVWMTRCKVVDTYSMLRIKTGRRRGGFVENVWMDHCQGKRMVRVFNIFTDYCAQWGKFPDFELRRTRIRNVSISDCTAELAGFGVQLGGDRKLPPSCIRVKNVAIGRAIHALTDIRNCTDVRIDGLALAPEGALAHEPVRHVAEGPSAKAYLEDGRWRQLARKVKPGDEVELRFAEDEATPVLVQAVYELGAVMVD